MGDGVTVWNVFLMLVYLALILAATYYTTRFIARKASGVAAPKGLASRFLDPSQQVAGHIQMRSRVNLDKDKVVCVLDYEGKRYLLAMTQGDIQVLQVEPIPPQPDDCVEKLPSFKDYLERLVTKGGKRDGS